MKKLKIGVLTFHRCINYGSYWQVRSLAEGLRSRGHDVAILDHYSGRVNIAEWKCAYRPVLPTPVPCSDQPLYREKIRKFFCSFEDLPLSSRFSLDDPEQAGEYDIVIIGSDEVWNLSHPWYGGCSLFFGDGIRSKRLISYAASFGNYPASWGLQQCWRDKLLQFDHISVRDENSQAIIEKALGTRPPLVLDPCLQFFVLPEEHVNVKPDQPYIAVYGHNFSLYFIERVKKFAARCGLPLISIGYRNDWADKQWITADPHEFAQFMAQAGSVVTNFFHGCVFSLRYNKPFVCETSPYRGNKLHGLLTKTGSENHLVSVDTPEKTYTTCLTLPLDESINYNIDRLRKTSDEYLEHSLNQANLY